MTDPNKLPDLEVTCPNCQGKGEVKNEDSDYRRTKTCYECEGYGFVVTEFGEKVLDFVRRRLVIQARVG